jgi:hypothetical protein
MTPNAAALSALCRIAGATLSCTKLQRSEAMWLNGTGRLIGSASDMRDFGIATNMYWRL